MYERPINFDEDVIVLGAELWMCDAFLLIGGRTIKRLCRLLVLPLTMKGEGSKAA